MTIQRDSVASRSTAHQPELPRVYLDTRMPPAPAPGRRVIEVGAPSARPRHADVATGTGVVAAVLVLAVLFRWARHRRPG